MADDDDDDPSSSSASSSFHWPGAIPLSQWIMATAGFAVDDEAIVRDFWVVVVATSAEDGDGDGDGDIEGSAVRSAKNRNQSAAAAAAAADRVKTTTTKTNKLRFDRSRRESLRSLLQTAVQQWTEQHNNAFRHNKNNNKNNNKRMMNHPQNQQYRPNKRQKKTNRSKTTRTTGNNDNEEEPAAAAAASAAAKVPAKTIVPPSNNHRNNGITASSTNILCQGFAWQPPFTQPVQRHLNAAVDYWVTSPHCQALHECLGDALIRYLWRFPVLVRLPQPPQPLLKTLTNAAAITTNATTNRRSCGGRRGGSRNDHAVDNKKDNAWQICGPPLHFWTGVGGGGGTLGTRHNTHNNKKRKRDDDANHKDNSKDNSKDNHKGNHKGNSKDNYKDNYKDEKKKDNPSKKKRRFEYRPVFVPKVLRPQFCLFRKGLLYQGLYTDKVGRNRLDDDAISSSPEALFRTMLAEYNKSSTSSSSSSSSDHSLSGFFLSTNLADKNDPQQQPPPPEEESLWRSVCVKILHHHRRLDYHRLLDRCCPLPELYRQLPLAVLANDSYCSGKQVTEFCRRVLEKLLPMEFWGHEKNCTHFLHRTLPILCTLRRHERFPNQRLVAGLRVRHMKWLMMPTTTTNESPSSPALSDTRRGHALLLQRVTCVFRWWVQRFLWESLLPRLFYATDTEILGKQEIVYYRNPIWSLLRNRALQALVDDPQRPHYERIPHDDDLTTTATVSRLRLLPKSTGVRPIATLHCAMSKGQKSSNAQLADAFTLLSHCLTPTAQYYGTGMQGMHELHAKYRSYLLQRAQMKNYGPESGPHHPRLYFCSVDIRHCYDNIQVDHLLQLLERAVLREPKYMMQKYFVAFANGTVKKRVVVGRPGDCRPFPDNCQGGDNELFDRAAVYIDGAQQQVVSSRDILAAIRDHFECNTVVVAGRYGHRYYRQVRGIPQGSVISTQCCNVYYGDMEKRLGLSSSSSSLLARMMDDFLLITTDVKERTQFLDRMAQGLPEKGVEIHPDKTKVSGDDDGDDETNHNVAVEECWFPWCGFLFHTTTGHVKLDYTRFYDDGLVAGSLTVRYQNRPGDHLRFQQLPTFCRPRCVPLLFDPAINAIDMRRYNFYQLMAFCAVKTCHYIDALDFVNTAFLSSAINETIIYAYRLIRSRLHHEFDDHVSSANEGRQPSSCFLGLTPATWLGRKAWNDVVRYKKGGCPSVIMLELPVLALSRKQRGRLERVAARAWKELRVDRLMMATRRTSCVGTSNNKKDRPVMTETNANQNTALMTTMGRTVTVSLVLWFVSIRQNHAWVSPVLLKNKNHRPAAWRLQAAVGIYFGTSTGNTDSVAHRIYEAIGADLAAPPVDVDSLKKGSIETEFAKHGALIIGTPTWNTGADTQRSGTGWDELYYSDKLPASLLRNKKVAVFGLGDQISYGENYADATGELYDVFEQLGCDMVQYAHVMPDDSYEHSASKSIRGDNKFCGLLLDEINQEDLTNGRIAKWVEQLRDGGFFDETSSTTTAATTTVSAAAAPAVAVVVEQRELVTAASAVVDAPTIQARRNNNGGVVGGFTPHYNSKSNKTMWTSPDGRKSYVTAGPPPPTVQTASLQP